MMETAERIKGVEEYYFSKKLREIGALNANGADILNLGIGSPDLMPAQPVINTLNSQAKLENVHGYQSYKGAPALREAFSKWYKNSYHVDLDADTEILPLMGSKEGIMHICMTYLNDGDEVLVPNPGYPAYSATAKLAGASCRYYELRHDNHWKPDLNALADTDLSAVKVMWVNYPNMPTGTNASLKLFEQLAQFGADHNILICNDNPYSFILNDKPLSLLSAGLSENILELNSLSKSHNMAGWRVGMIGAQSQHIQNILTFKSNMDSGMFLPLQLAAAEALEQPASWYDEINTVYTKRRKTAWQIMDELNCQYDTNQVGMFIWARVPETVDKVEKWLNEIMHEAEVFITPGFIFGSNGNRYIRISLCSKTHILTEALQRIKNYNVK